MGIGNVCQGAYLIHMIWHSCMLVGSGMKNSKTFYQQNDSVSAKFLCYNILQVCVSCFDFG